MIITATYRLPSGDWQAPFAVQSIEELADLVEGKEFRISVDPADLPEILAWLRAEAGMVQRELGEAIGYPRPVVANIEGGQRKLGLATLTRIVEALGCSVRVEISKPGR